MSIAGTQAHAFYKQVASGRKVWTVRDSEGYPAPRGDEGKRVMPFWSSLDRVSKIISNVPAYSQFVAEEIRWEIFRDRWLPGLKRDGLLVGVNWSGSRAIGFDVQPETVREAVEFQIGLRATE